MTESSKQECRIYNTYLTAKVFQACKSRRKICKQEKSLSVKADTEKIEMKNSSYKYVLYIQEKIEET